MAFSIIPKNINDAAKTIEEPLEEHVKVQIPLDSSISPGSPDSITYINEILKKAFAKGILNGTIEENLLNFDPMPDENAMIVKLKAGTVQDASKLGESINGHLILNMPDEFDSAKNVVEEVKNFSMASLSERMIVGGKNPIVQMRYIIKDYRRYYAQKKDKCKEDSEFFDRLKGLFLTDLMGLFTSVMPIIVEQGKDIGRLLGISQVDPKLQREAFLLSIAYRKAMAAEEKTGQIPKNRYGALKNQYNKFINSLIAIVFPE